ncbi:MAG: HutP family protein [Oscillospiraceae bacterium]|nr:HutP family protein [Oscillospiraceae bacterium]
MEREPSMGSREVGRAALILSMTRSREEEKSCKAIFREEGILTAAVDYGGEFVSSIMRIVERTVVAAKREGLINDTHLDEGAAMGAAREALSQVSVKALGLNVGGKVGIARCGEHIAVAVFFGVGLVHLNEVCVGMGHRAI